MTEATASRPVVAQPKAQIHASDIPSLLASYGNQIRVLSLDCFDTLLWRQTAAPKDVFAWLAASDVAKKFGVTPQQRISAAAGAYREKWVTAGSRQIHISDIYKRFTALSATEQAALVEAEIQAEIALCFAFLPFVELIREAKTRGIRVIIVSDIYYREPELRRLLSHHLPQDVLQAIDTIYCSVDAGMAKSDGLFPLILEQIDVPPAAILHIGDHPVSDFEAPRRAGLQSAHFLQFERKVTDFLRLQQAGAALTVLAKTTPNTLTVPRYSPYRAMFATAELKPYAQETLIGYMSFGPVLYAYARFLTDEVAALQKQGKRVKVFFLLRDAYLLSRACEAYTRQQIGKLLRIRKFVAVAASFRTREDVDYYISGIKPEYYNFHVIAEQLLLPPELTVSIIQMAHSSPNPQAAFHELLHQANVLQIIFANSAAYRERLKRYMIREMGLEAGDTIVLADTGFVGVTQDYLTRTFSQEMNVEFLGRYVLASHEPDRPDCKALITTTWCDHSLFEQSCTFKEGAVVDYNAEGEPLFEPIKLSDEQYRKVSALQSECIRFIHDAKTFFTRSGITHAFPILQEAAHAALMRHVYLPMAEELEYFKPYQHDKDMGPDLKKTVYNVQQAQAVVTKLHSPYAFNAYEARALGMDFAFSALLRRGFQLELTPEDMTVRTSPLKIILAKENDLSYQSLNALHMHDGYFSLVLPYLDNVGVGLVFGEHYEWLQLEKVKLMTQAGIVSDDMSAFLVFNEINQQGPVSQCLSRSSLVMIKPIASQQGVPHYYHIVFRPLAGWAV